MTNKDYDRLTYRPYKNDKVRRLKPDGEEEDFAERLYELENAIENGTLRFLPCKVGDTVYFVNYRLGRKPIESYIVDRITLTSTKVIFDTHQIEPPYNLGLIYSDSWGKNVFFTKETAEKAWEEAKKC